MPSISQTATITSKGQITLPKSIRDALGVGLGGKVTFELRGSKVLVSRTKATRHEDPAIAKFLALLEKDMEAGRSIGSLPKSVAKKMLASLNQPVDLNTEIEGDVAL